MLRFVERLNDLISEKDVTPQQIKATIGVDVYHRKSEKNEYTPLLPDFIKLANYFECSLGYLAGLEEQTEKYSFKTELPPFGERLRFIIKQKGISVKKLAQEAHLSGTIVIYQWFSGKYFPRVGNLIELSKALDCSLDYLVGREK